MANIESFRRNVEVKQESEKIKTRLEARHALHALAGMLKDIHFISRNADSRFSHDVTEK